jgi:hypothetical protein
MDDILPLQFELAHFDIDRQISIPGCPKLDRRRSIGIRERQLG